MVSEERKTAINGCNEFLIKSMVEQQGESTAKKKSSRAREMQRGGVKSAIICSKHAVFGSRRAGR